MIPPQPNCLRYPQTVPIHHQQQQVVADAMAAALGRFKQLGHFARIEKVLAPFMRIGGVANACFRDTLYISPFGCHLPTPRKAPYYWGLKRVLFTKGVYCKELKPSQSRRLLGSQGRIGAGRNATNS